LSARLLYAQEQLDVLKRTNLFDDAF
jgi:hypothetical protein